MRVGDLVRRKKPMQPARHVADSDRLGIVVGIREGGNGPRHNIASVFYTGTLEQHDIAFSLIEVIG